MCYGNHKKEVGTQIVHSKTNSLFILGYIKFLIYDENSKMLSKQVRVVEMSIP